MEVLLLIWLIAGPIVGHAIGKPKGLGTTGAWLGFFFGFLGWIAVGLMSPTPQAQAANARRVARLAGPPGRPVPQRADPQRRCPWCAERIQAAARICRYCQRDVEPMATSALVAEPARYGGRTMASALLAGDEVLVDGHWRVISRAEKDDRTVSLELDGGRKVDWPAAHMVDARHPQRTIGAAPMFNANDSVAEPADSDLSAPTADWGRGGHEGWWKASDGNWYPPELWTGPPGTSPPS